jgi:hypothetical protein
MAETDTQGSAGQSTGSIFLRKTGPLANWIWMAILLLVALVYSLWKRNAAGAGAEELDGPVVDDVPDNQTPPPVFILPQNPQPTVPVNVVVNNPGTPPGAPPVATRPTVPPVVKPKPTAPAKPAVAYQTVKVAKYTSHNPPWNSTLWGIAKNAGYGSASKNWTTIWNDPKNAALKKKRGQPEKIQPGDTIYVRKK